MTSFVKHDAEKKLPLHLVPFVAVEEMAKVLAFGAKKYSAHGWRKVDKRSRYLAAALRHLFAYARGEDIDQESGLPHLSHALTCVAFLVECNAGGLGEDDRVEQPPATPVDRRVLIGAEMSLRQAAARAQRDRAPLQAARYRHDADRVAALLTPAAPAASQETEKP